MRQCLICGKEIEQGTHHNNTTECIRYLRDRIDVLERAINRGSTAPPLPPGLPV